MGFSVNGLKLSGDVPLRLGQMCPLTVTLPNQEHIVVTAAIVRWVRSPPKKRLYLLFTQILSEKAMTTLAQWFGSGTIQPLTV